MDPKRHILKNKSCKTVLSLQLPNKRINKNTEVRKLIKSEKYNSLSYKVNIIYKHTSFGTYVVNII